MEIEIDGMAEHSDSAKKFKCSKAPAPKWVGRCSVCFEIYAGCYSAEIGGIGLEYAICPLHGRTLIWSKTEEA